MDPGVVFLFGVVFVGGWLVSLRLWPYGRCRRCRGTGLNWGSNRKRFGRCGKCGNTGTRERFGVGLVFRKK